MPSTKGRGLDAIAEMLGQVEPARSLRVKFDPMVGAGSAVCEVRVSVWSEGLNNTRAGTAVLYLYVRRPLAYAVIP